MEDIPHQSPERQPSEEDLEALRRAIARVGIQTALEVVKESSDVIAGQSVERIIEFDGNNATENVVTDVLDRQEIIQANTKNRNEPFKSVQSLRERIRAMRKKRDKSKDVNSRSVEQDIHVQSLNQREAERDLLPDAGKPKPCITIAVKHNDETIDVKVPVRKGELGSNILKLNELLNKKTGLGGLNSQELGILRDGYEGMTWAIYREEARLRSEIQECEAFTSDDSSLKATKEELDRLYEIQLQHAVILRDIKIRLRRDRSGTSALWYSESVA